MNFKIKKILSKVRLFFKRVAWKNILTFLLFLILAIIFWFMLIYRQSFETRVDIPIKYTHMPPNIILEKEPPTQISLRFRDDGASLFKYFFTARNDSLEVDFRKSSNTKVLSQSYLSDLIRLKLNKSTTILDFYPSQISLEYDTLRRKRIPVVFDGQISLAPGFMLREDIRVMPDSVDAFASGDILNKLSYAYTTSDTIENYNKNKPLSFDLVSVEGVRYNPSKILVEIPIEEFTQKDLQIPITCLNMQDEFDLKIFPSTVKVSFFVSLSQYEQIKVQDFEIQLDFEELKKLETSSVPVRLTSVPDHISNIRIEPSVVEFIIEQK